MREAGVPEHIQFQTKPGIALALLDEANRIGVPHEAVVTDASYGGDDPYLSGLESRKEHYVNAVPYDFTFILEEDPQADVQRADAVMHQFARKKWRTIRWREGTKGWLGRKFIAVRAYRHCGWRAKDTGLAHWRETRIWTEGEVEILLL